MFGDFLTNFGLNAFPWDTLDAQGGLFGSNTPQSPQIGSQSSGFAAPPQAGGHPSSGSTVAPQGSPPIGAPSSPLSLGGQSPLALPETGGGGATPIPGQNPPAAGVNSEFGTGS